MKQIEHYLGHANNVLNHNLVQRLKLVTSFLSGFCLSIIQCEFDKELFFWLNLIFLQVVKWFCWTLYKCDDGQINSVFHHHHNQGYEYTINYESHMLNTNHLYHFKMDTVYYFSLKPFKSLKYSFLMICSQCSLGHT